ncbi:MAG: protein-L-isoaspartate(D-aspartate) O-methyltransferase [Planctomycetota bacterium]
MPDGPIERRQRARMVRDHLTSCDDPRVVAAMAALPRHDFVPADARGRAYDDGALPIGSGVTISQPRIVALMLAALRLKPGDRVLDIGCGSGYVAALLADLVSPGGSVEAIERIAALVPTAAQRLQSRSVTVRHGDGHAGLPSRAPFDAIHVAAAAPTFPIALLDQLALGGRMVMPIGPDEHGQELWLVERGRGGITQRNLGQVVFVPFLHGMDW